MDNVAALVVTYNRLDLLKEAIISIKNQTVPIDKIIVIDNGCTDGSKAWLKEQPELIIVNQEINSGASGGFHIGIKTAVNINCDWIWIMDDDTICKTDTLENLLNKIHCVEEKVGFIGSKCSWLNTEPHLMNVPDIKPNFHKKIPFNKYDNKGLLVIESNSWVSVLINVQAVRQVGLPYKEFFFWSDDVEYTQRITKAGYLGLYAINSVVLHKTLINYSPDFYHEESDNLWKHKYGFRNEFYLKRKNNGIVHFYIWLVAKLGYTSYKMIKIRKADHIKFLRVLWGSAWNSLFFNPKLDRV